MSTTSCGINENGTLTKDRSKIGHIGDIIAFYGSTAPEGTLVCNGAAISRTTYSELFGVIGTTAGAGDGSTTFNLPDLRGLFLRGLNGTNAAALGVEQGDAMRNIDGSFSLRDVVGSNGQLYTLIGRAIPPFRWTQNVDPGSNHALSGLSNAVFGVTEIYYEPSTVVPNAAENRPVNTAVLYCMIYE